MNCLINLPIFLQLSEGDKRFIFVLLVALIVIIAVIGAIGYAIQKVMKAQGRRINIELSDAVKTYKVITEKKQFMRYATLKSVRIFLKDSWIPVLIIAAGFITLWIREIVYNSFSYNPFSTINGFGSLLWTWDFANPENYSKFFGLTLLSQWPKLSNTPHFVSEAWAGYIAVPCFLIGGFWYIIFNVQGFIARQIYIYKLRSSLFDIDLESYKIESTNNEEHVTINEQK